jgi:hypothetical protein
MKHKREERLLPMKRKEKKYVHGNREFESRVYNK